VKRQRTSVANYSIVTSTIVASGKSVARPQKHKLFVKAAGAVVIHLWPFAVEMLKMQFDAARLVEIGREVMRSAGGARAHMKDRILDFRRKKSDTL
jgi:hypothetical protein